MEDNEKFENKFDIVCKKCGAHNCEFDLHYEMLRYSMSFTDVVLVFDCPICKSQFRLEF